MTEVGNLASKISLGTGSLHRPDVGWQGGIRQGSFGRPPRQNLCSATRRRDKPLRTTLGSHSSDNLFPAGIGLANVDRVLTPTVAFV
jgi:hypothetical protein